MSLITASMKRCIWLEPNEAEDGEGGVSTVWNAAGYFYAAVNQISSTRRVNAERYEATNMYAVTVDANTALPFGGVFKRLSDGKTFRLVTDGSDKRTPETSALNIRRATAEEWRLPQ